MKSCTCIYFIFFTINFLFWACSLAGQTTPAASPNGATVLTGSTLKVEDITSKTESIFVGKIDKVSLNAPTVSGFTSLVLQVNVTQVFKGVINGKVKLWAFVQSDAKEDKPANGGAYIFFVNKDHNFPIVTKLVPATNDAVDTVKALILNAKR